MRLAIVGAGPAGLAALRALRARGFDAVAFERRPCVGGVWALRDDERPTAAYRSLHLITSRARTEFGELPMPDGTPDYPSRDAVGRYLEGYAEHFGLTDRIRLGAGIRSARHDGDGWEIELESGERERFDRLVVANGHNEEPKWPDPLYPGDFDGRQLHALDYTEGEDFRDQNVLVVGMGNSAMDIATDISLVADRTYLSARHGTWVIPKRLLGQPADQIIKPWVAVHVPWRIRQPLSQFLLRLTVGPPERYGLPEPTRGLFQDHPTITDTVLSRISHGELTPKPGIASLAAGSVAFTDGSEEAVDAIVWCTGYRVSMPFLDDSLTGPDPKQLPLYKRIFHLDCPDLYFIGLMQSTGSAFPIVERQAQILAEHLAGDWYLPSPADQRRDCERRHRYALARWGEHGRPAMRVDFDRFMHELGEELERGRTRVGA
ncbi:MAG TPA: NAD(P)-binding domain-containing protein [Thermoleophilaceae bacterium]|nr:NAD(P)-binding domain-containing protein [Thermoleophilaceae bacterium]